jgi:hypothetical protein
MPYSADEIQLLKAVFRVQELAQLKFIQKKLFCLTDQVLNDSRLAELDIILTRVHLTADTDPFNYINTRDVVFKLPNVGTLLRDAEECDSPTNEDDRSEHEKLFELDHCCEYMASGFKEFLDGSNDEDGVGWSTGFWEGF